MLQELGGAMVLGPLIVGPRQARADRLAPARTDADIVNMAALARLQHRG
jgi:phosphotransacetylase